MQNRPMQAMLGLALGLLLVGAGCSSTTTVKTEVTPTPDAMEKKDDAMMPKEDGAMEKKDDAMVKVDVGAGMEADAAMGALKEVKITAKQFTFSPSEVRVKQGERVKLTVMSEDVSHGLNIPAFNVNLTLEPSKSGTVEFVADKKGSFPFFCSAFCGSGHGGMKGTLIVE